MSDLFIPPLEQWPEWMLIEMRERANIRHFDGGQDLETADAEAMREVWAQYGE